MQVIARGTRGVRAIVQETVDPETKKVKSSRVIERALSRPASNRRMTLERLSAHLGTASLGCAATRGELSVFPEKL